MTAFSTPTGKADQALTPPKQAAASAVATAAQPHIAGAFLHQRGWSPHSHPVTLSGSMCTSEQISIATAPPSQATLMVPPPAVAASAAADLQDTADSGGSEGDVYITPEDSTQGSSSAHNSRGNDVSSAGKPAGSRITTAGSAPPQPPHPTPSAAPAPAAAAEAVASWSPEALTPVAAGWSSTFAVADTLRFLSSSFTGSLLIQAEKAVPETGNAPNEESKSQCEPAADIEGLIGHEATEIEVRTEEATVGRLGDHSALQGAQQSSNAAEPAVDIIEEAPVIGRKSALAALKGRIHSRQMNVLRRSRR